MRTRLRSVVDAIPGRVPALASAQIGLGGRSTATSAQSWLFWLVFLLTGASVFILGTACAMVFLAYRDCSAAAGYYGCAYPLAGMFVLALGLCFANPRCCSRDFASLLPRLEQRRLDRPGAEFRRPRPRQNRNKDSTAKLARFGRWVTTTPGKPDC